MLPGLRLRGQAAMNKAFTRENDAEEDDGDVDVEDASLPEGTKNYVTPGGFQRLKAELDALVDKERPAMVATVAWAASNGDRSENGDYIYGKKRLREIDRRIRFLVRRLDRAEVVDPLARRDADDTDRVFFGATVIVRDRVGAERTVSIVGVDERHQLELELQVDGGQRGQHAIGEIAGRRVEDLPEAADLAHHEASGQIVAFPAAEGRAGGEDSAGDHRPSGRRDPAPRPTVAAGLLATDGRLQHLPDDEREHADGHHPSPGLRPRDRHPPSANPPHGQRRKIAHAGRTGRKADPAGFSGPDRVRRSGQMISQP